jgi:ParB family transcriptional regulator, chromosome partitioning protein
MMAKRKRLTPSPTPVPVIDGPAPETKGLPNGWAGVRTRPAPIADIAGASATHAALEEVAEQMAEARREGRLVQRIPLDAIDESHLVRDRTAMDADELTSLEQSLRSRGQQTPLEVVALGQGRYGLISGWRRLVALRRLRKEDPGGSFDTALCFLRMPQTASDAYLAMVEENEIRAALSFYERARIAARAAEQGAYPTARHAVKGLFANASASKRSKITSFLGIYAALDEVLHFPAALSERAGLALAKALEEDAGLAGRIAGALADRPSPDAAAEQQMLGQLMQPRVEWSQTPAPATLAPATPAPASSDTAKKPLEEGIRVTRREGRLVLTGTGVTEELMDAIEDWLSTRT